MSSEKIVITGAAGLVGQNLIQRLSRKGVTNVVAIDKNTGNAAVLRRLHPSLRIVVADLAVHGEWEREFESCTTLVIGHAQIGGVDPAEFARNNVQATERVLEAATRYRIPYLVHISSSVVNSAAIDNYTETKKRQETLVANAGLTHIVLRPTLMFGWFDRKHLGWLARFMSRSPVFPIPGSGRYLRQPLYVGDFCEIIIAALEKKMIGSYNISGRERIDYIDLINLINKTTGNKTRIQRIPYWLFWILLNIYSVFDANPPFTTAQLKALATPDLFEVIDWPQIFGVNPTKLENAISETFRDPVFSQISLAF